MFHASCHAQSRLTDSGWVESALKGALLILSWVDIGRGCVWAFAKRRRASLDGVCPKQILLCNRTLLCHQIFHFHRSPLYCVGHPGSLAAVSRIRVRLYRSV